MLLLNQPHARVLSSKKVHAGDLLKFLISNGMASGSIMTKNELCMAFRTLIESQPDYVQPPTHYALPQQMPVANNILPIAQNNNMMQSIEQSVPQV